MLELFWTILFLCLSLKLDTAEVFKTPGSGLCRPVSLSKALPLGLLRLLKPCKVKRFLAIAERSVVGLVTASSANDGVKWKCGVCAPCEQRGCDGGEREAQFSQRAGLCVKDSVIYCLVTFVFRRSVQVWSRCWVSFLLVLLLLVFLPAAERAKEKRMPSLDYIKN